MMEINILFFLSLAGLLVMLRMKVLEERGRISILSKISDKFDRHVERTAHLLDRSSSAVREHTGIRTKRLFSHDSGMVRFVRSLSFGRPLGSNGTEDPDFKKSRGAASVFLKNISEKAGFRKIRSNHKAESNTESPDKEDNE